MVLDMGFIHKVGDLNKSIFFSLVTRENFYSFDNVINLNMGNNDKRSQKKKGCPLKKNRVSLLKISRSKQ
jgi:hypothetical protein